MFDAVLAIATEKCVTLINIQTIFGANLYFSAYYWKSRWMIFISCFMHTNLSKNDLGDSSIIDFTSLFVLLEFHKIGFVDIEVATKL